MPVLRRVVTVALLGMGLTACGYQTTNKRVSEQVNTITTVARTASGSPEKIAEAVRGAPLGDYMSLEVLSSERTVPEGGSQEITRLEYKLHFEGWPDGFGDVPASTTCYRMDFDGSGLIDEPVEIDCPDTSRPG